MARQRSVPKQTPAPPSGRGRKSAAHGSKLAALMAQADESYKRTEAFGQARIPCPPGDYACALVDFTYEPARNRDGDEFITFRPTFEILEGEHEGVRFTDRLSSRITDQASGSAIGLGRLKRMAALFADSEPPSVEQAIEILADAASGEGTECEVHMEMRPDQRTGREWPNYEVINVAFTDPESSIDPGEDTDDNADNDGSLTVPSETK